MSSLGQYKIVPAQVVALSSESGYARSLTVDAGTRDGVHRNMTVLSGDGLVGRVISAGPTTATVLLLTDPSFSVGARLAGSSEIGLVQGSGTDPLGLELYNAQAAVADDDIVLTSGSPNGRPFVSGVPIGFVTELIATPGALTRQALVEPYVNFTSLNIVGIVVEEPREDPRDALIAPSPSPSPSVTDADSSSSPDTSPDASPGASPSP
jgi:rod shape-determining protein MreC